MGDNKEEELILREEKLAKRMEAIKKMEEEVIQKEKSIKEKEKARKQVLLRLSPTLWNDLAAWAEADFRSINSQIEYLLAECVKNRKK